MNKELTYGLKTLFVLMVFLQHFIFAVNQGAYTEILPAFLLIFRGDIAVGCLFLVSGYVLMKSWSSKQPSFPVQLVNRIGRLVIPMIGAYAILYAIGQIGAGEWGLILPRMGYDWGYILSIGTSDQFKVSDLVASFINQLMGYNDQQILVAWLLRHELFVSLVLLALLRAFRNKESSSVLTLIMVSLVALSLYRGDGYGLYAAFGVGAIFAQQENRIKELSGKLQVMGYLLVAVTAYTVLLLGMLWDDHYKAVKINEGYSWLIFLMTDDRYFVYSLLLPYFSIVVMLLSRNKHIKMIMNWSGPRSYSLYLMSQFSMQMSVWAIFKLDIYLPPVVLLLLCLSVCVLLGGVFYRYVEKPSMKLWRQDAMDGAKAKELSSL